jgi:hypothetical protein
MEIKEESFKYDVAISFAGEDRQVAEEIANALVARNVRVFYDQFEKSSLWGKDLFTHLAEVYGNTSRYCLMLVSEHYVSKEWTNHERKSAQDRSVGQRIEYILPVRLDDAIVPGLHTTIGFIDLRTTSINELVDLIVAKLGAVTSPSNNKCSNIATELIRNSNYLDSSNIIIKGEGNKIFGFGSISSRTNGFIPSTINSKDPYIEFEILILNCNTTPIELKLRNMRLETKYGKTIPAFKGEEWSDGFIWLGPRFNEFNGINISNETITSIKFGYRESVVFQVSFGMAARYEEKEAAMLCKKILVPIFLCETNERIALPLLIDVNRNN